MDLGRYRLSLDRADDRRGRSPRGGRRVGLMFAAAAMMVAASAGPAAAEGGATGYVEMPQGGLRSISATPPGFDYDTCYGIDGGYPQQTVEIPNGVCQGPTYEITIVNGSAPADVLVEGSDFVPSDGATPWILCVQDAPGMPPGPLCTSPGPGGGFPGPDQADLQVTNAPDGVFSIGAISTVSGTPSCDEAFDPYQPGQPGCSAVPGQSQVETPFFRAPASSTDQSPTFSNTITWIAAPPSS